MNKPLIIYGAGGLGREILGLLKSLPFEIKGFIDDGIGAGKLVNGLKILGKSDFLASLTSPTSLIVAIGSPSAKATVVENISRFGNSLIDYPVIIHPSALLQDAANIRLGAGTVITAGCILTTNISVGSHVLINLNSTIGHDTTIGSFSSVMPSVNIAGGVNVGQNVLIGSGACIMNNKKIGDNSKVGMGAVVIDDVEQGSTVVGIPARPIRVRI